MIGIGWAIGLSLLGGISSIAGISTRSRQREEQYKSQMQDLDRQQDQLDEQYKQFNQTYALLEANKKASVSDANAELDLQADLTERNRDTALGTTAKGQEMQQGIEQMQLATLAVDASQSEGAAIQQAAATGFRNGGTLMDSVEQVNRDNEDAINQAKAKLSLSRYSTYQEAKQGYTSATQQAESYQRQIELNSKELERQLGEMSMKKEQAAETYKRSTGYLESDINYMRTTGRSLTTSANIADAFGSLASFGSDLYKIWG